MRISNNRKLLPYRRELRQRQTLAEKRLWQFLRGRQLQGIKFFRQYSLGPFIADFYCPTYRVVIELDGGYHFEKRQQVYDAYRTSEIEYQKIRVIRFENNEIFSNLDGVLERIIHVCYDHCI